ncbi:MAG: hypothetical protein OEY92_00445, partial [Elusimicrobiota bacterium]|nr:hypothetical protein [Elusimicrobiota bacterium]
MVFFAITCILTFLVSLILGFVVYFKSGRRKVNGFLALSILSTALWSLGLGLMVSAKYEELALFWLRGVHYLGAIFIPVFFLHFVLAFLEMDKIERKLILFTYIVAIVLQICNFTGTLASVVPKNPFRYYTKAGPFYPIFTFMFFSCVVYSLYLLFKAFRTSSGVKRNQIRYLFLGTGIGFTAGSTAFFPVFNIPIFPFGMYFVFIYSVILSYAIIQYRLMDIAVVVTRGGVLAGTYAFIIGVPALVASVARPWLVGAMERFWWVPPLGLFAGLALVGPFAALFFIRKIEWKQREKELTAEEHLERTAQGMIEIDSVKRLVKIIPRYLTQFYYSALDIRITHATIFLLDKDRGEYVLKSASGTRRISLERTLPEKENPIYIWFKKIVPLIIEKRFVRRRELDVLQREDIDFWLKEERLLRLGDYIKPALTELKKLMVELKAVLCVPSYYQDGLLGFLILGEKERGLFRPQELSLFFRLSRYAGLAIRSAQLSQDLQQAYASVAQADRLSSMGQLAASFAHEINNPVAIIISGIELSLATMREELVKAQSIEEKEKVVEYTEDKLIKIKDEAFRISHIIDRIMGYVRAPMGDFTSVGLEELIETTLGLVEHPLRKKQINVVKEIPEDLPRIRGIAGELQEVFLNLFNNAIEAMEYETPGSINILARAFGNP